MKVIKSIGDIVERAAARKRRSRLAVALPHEAAVLEAVARAAGLGLVEPILIGCPKRIERAAREAGINLTGFKIVPAADDAHALRSSVAMVGAGEADILMKGLVASKALLRTVLDPHLGMRTAALLSQVAVFEPPTMKRILLLTDAGVNIAPKFMRKLQIVRNAVWVAKRLGIRRPRVAMIAAVEKLELPAMPATLDARVVERISRSDATIDAVVEGPLALDNAVSEELAALKGIKGDVAGRADILCMPDIETGNVLYKSLTCFAGVTMASVIVGASAPIVMPSRSDEAETKLYSIALATLLIRGTSTSLKASRKSGPKQRKD